MNSRRWAGTRGIVAQMRGEDVDQLIRYDPKGFILTTVIARRANRHIETNIAGCRQGEAIISDHDNYGFTREAMRQAIARLKKLKIATTRTTTKKTYARLLDLRLYDINPESKQPLKQPTNNQPTTTNKEYNKKRKRGGFIKPALKENQKRRESDAELGIMRS